MGLLGALLALPAVAPSAALGAFSEPELDAIAQHAYRGGASPISGVGCGAQCSSLWAAETGPMTATEWVRSLHRELFVLRQRTKLYPPTAKFDNPIPLSASKPVFRWRVGASWGFDKRISMVAAPPSTGREGPLTGASMVPPFQSSGAGVSTPALGFWGILANGSVAVKPTYDYHPGLTTDRPVPCSGRTEAPMNYPGWEMLRAPTYPLRVSCGTLLTHWDAAFHRAEPHVVGGLTNGMVEDYSPGQSVTEPVISSWFGSPTTWAMLRSRVVSELFSQSHFYPVLVDWYEHQLQGAPPPDEDVFLARKFQPVLRFDSAERWRPLNVDDFFAERDQAGAGLHRICIPLASPDAAEIAPGHSGTEAHPDDLTSAGGIPEYHCERVTSQATLSDWNSPDAFLDLQEEASQEANDYRGPAACVTGPLLDCDTSRSTAYYSVGEPPSQGYRLIVYWFFYRFNDWRQYNDELFDHEGDWEGIEVAPSTTNPETFDYVSFSGHGHWYSYARSNLECDNGASDAKCTANGAPIGSRVRAYVAEGSHASYPSACPLDPGCIQASPDTISPEHRSDGKWFWGMNYTADGSQLRSTQPGWYNWSGRWGVHRSPPSPGQQPPDGDNWECAHGSLNTDCPARPSRARRRAPVTQADRNRRAARCANWFGPGVVAVLCTPTLRAAVKSRLLGRAGRLRVRVLRRPTIARTRQSIPASAASVTALAQTIGDPLRAGDRVRVTGRIPAGSVLMLRGQRGKRQVARRLHIMRSRSQLTVRVRPAARRGVRFVRSR